MCSLVSASLQAQIASPASSILLKRDGTVISWNIDFEKIEGYSASEVIGKKFTHFFSSLDTSPNAFEKIIRQTIQKGKTKYKGIHFKKDGSILRGYIILKTLRDEARNIIGFHLFVEKDRSYTLFNLNSYPLLSYSCKKLIEYGKNTVRYTLNYFIPKGKKQL